MQPLKYLSKLILITLIFFSKISSALPGDGKGNNPTDETSSPAQTSTQFQFYFERASNGIGGILQTQTRTYESAESLLATAFREVSSYFKKGPFGISGFSDVSGRETQIFFQANYQGHPVTGLATAAVNPQTQQAVIKFIFNQPAHLNTTLKNMARQAVATGGSSHQNPVESLQWHWEESREGATRLKLPAGWQIVDSNKEGWVIARGPHGSVSFGFYFYIYTPAHLAAPMNPNLVIAQYCDPMTAFKNVLPEAIQKVFYQMNGQPAPQFNNQIIEATPVSGPPGSQAAMIHCDVQIIQPDGTRKHNRGLATVVTAPTGMAQWMLYYSEVCSPATSFNENLPVLWEIWKSWKTSDAVFQQRIDNALKSLNEANQIYQQAMQERERVMEDAFSDWDEYIRGYRYIEDTDNNRLSPVDLHLAQPLVEKMNHDLGYQRYREVPMREFNRRY